MSLRLKMSTFRNAGLVVRQLADGGRPEQDQDQELDRQELDQEQAFRLRGGLPPRYHAGDLIRIQAINHSLGMTVGIRRMTPTDPTGTRIFYKDQECDRHRFLAAERCLGKIADRFVVVGLALKAYPITSLVSTLSRRR